MHVLIDGAGAVGIAVGAGLAGVGWQVSFLARGATLEAIRYYAAHNRTEVRIPVIPSFNDTPEEIQAMLDLLAELGAKKAALLPYHTFGVSKYKNLDRPYQLAGIDKLEESDVAELLEKVKIPDCLQVEIHVK